ncbi:U6 snRNA-associated Sm-like protein LSm8, putative [Theileria equi strain WA]|uniref:U6 snRNA-associated Sm-like protein LSm8 n=1 Tax=Theileria equi strain WA TaxID=1537102 RepID=L1LC24_THEEQ|nr:U6 snRNA-associated Sm-like protein LSm8, putative [Theileria equi strain WA]EKX72824.1 U6 snRNA-associated Sm-like protein LSm8, putative [Theileria equi strain WA]|eukprot:XP_004832276.1 U6 snRNA-associated Sm-like protein LSm8, putative [Theileria equi strain WA]
MAPLLEQFIECHVFVISVDGRVFVGVLKGFDQLTNLVLYNCIERVYHVDSPVEELELGIYVVRGDNVVLVGEVDLDVDRSMSGIEAQPLKPVVY